MCYVNNSLLRSVYGGLSLVLYIFAGDRLKWFNETDVRLQSKPRHGNTSATARRAQQRVIQYGLRIEGLEQPQAVDAGVDDGERLYLLVIEAVLDQRSRCQVRPDAGRDKVVGADLNQAGIGNGGAGNPGLFRRDLGHIRQIEAGLAD